MADTTLPSLRLGYQPALDGVRGIAVTLVVLYHYPWRGLASGDLVDGGFLGVDVFFVLSGFLITSLLLQEHAARGAISLRNFYARRALRLLPAFAVLWVIAVALHFTLAAGDPLRPQTVGLVGALVYVGNWVNISHPGALGMLAHTFSLAIEEQFYLVWPVILIVLLRRRLRFAVIAAITAVGALASAAYRAAYWQSHLGRSSFLSRAFGLTVHPMPATAAASAVRRVGLFYRVYSGSDTRADALLAGCVTAILVFWILPRFDARARARVSVASLVGLVAAVVIVGHATKVAAWLAEWGFLALAVSVGLVIAGLVAAPRGPLARALACAPLRWLGRRSYAIYLFHELVYVAFERSHVRLSPARLFALQMVAIVVAAEVSYRLVEAPMLRRKQRFELHAGALG